ncbi:MAG: transcriptional repressor [Clostridia bacterium]|nr:transcriptional repressor [Clostridia bacterium]
MPGNEYKTKQKQSLLRVLRENSERALTIEEWTALLHKQGAPIGKTTVYRWMDKLVESGLVRKFTAGRGQSATFQPVEPHRDCDSHLHLKCVSCGKFIHLDCDVMAGVNEHVLEHHGFQIDNRRSLLYGLCEDCLKKENRHGAD